MASKKTKELAVAGAQMSERSDISDAVTLSDAERSLAERLNLDITAPQDDRLFVAIGKTNQAVRLIVEAGVLYMSIKAECGHGEFIARLDSAGVDRRRAHESMVLARALAVMPETHIDAVMSLSKTKALTLASADPKVVESMLEDGEIDIDRMSVRALTDRIRELEAGMTDVTVQRDTAEAELDAARKKLAKKPGERDDAIPHAVADLRAELLALGKKAELAIDGFNAAGVDVMLLVGTDAAHEWADATLRLAASNLIAIRLQLDGVIKKYLDQLPGQDPTPTERSFLSRLEVVETAKRFAELTALHEHEKALREWEAEQARPQGKGRPRNKPEAPKTGA